MCEISLGRFESGLLRVNRIFSAWKHIVYSVYSSVLHPLSSRADQERFWWRNTLVKIGLIAAKTIPILYIHTISTLFRCLRKAGQTSTTQQQNGIWMEFTLTGLDWLTQTATKYCYFFLFSPWIGLYFLFSLSWSILCFVYSGIVGFWGLFKLMWLFIFLATF